MADNTVKVGFKGAGEQVRAHVKPGDTLVFENVDFDNVKIDILGPDVILTDPATGAKIFLPGLGLILFSTEDAPSLMMADGTEVTSQMILSKVGAIQNVTQEDFLTFTSLDLNPEQGSEQLNMSGLEESTENEELRNKVQEQQEQLEEQQQQLEEQTEEFFSIASKLEDFTSELDGENSSALRAKPENEETTPNDDTIESIQSSRADFVKDATGALTKPPAQPAAAGTPEQFNNENESEGDGAVLAAANLELSAKLLQVAAIDDISGSGEYRGGGASEAGVFDNTNGAQFSRETIDTSVEVGPHTIYTDNPDYFDASTMTRLLQVAPAIPLGFVLDDVTIEGLPNDFNLYLSDGTPLVADGSGNYDLNTPTLDGNGNLNLFVEYPIPNTQLFTLNIASSSTFDPGSGLPTPDITTQTFSVIQKIDVKDVNDPDTDGNYANGDLDAGTTLDDGSGNITYTSDTVWVMANAPNDNRVFTGTGDTTVIGAGGADQVTSSDGNDIIQTAGGNDIVSAGSGDDTVRGGLGDDRMNGGDDNDTADFSDMTDSVTLDLGGAVNGDGFYEATIGNGDVDELINFENIIGGDGNDDISGDANNNELTGSDGDDTLSGADGDDVIDGGNDNDTISGGLGDDTLIGGAGTDTLDYSYSAGNISANLTANTITVTGETDTINGFENFIGGTGNMDVTGTATDNIINVSTAAYAEVYAGGGNDTVIGNNTENYLYGQDGNDTLTGGNGYDEIEGGDGNDIISAGGDDDYIVGGDGNDTIDAGAGNDDIVAGAGNDQVDGGAGTADTLTYLGFGSGITVDIDDASGFATLTVGAETDMIRNIERLYGTNFADDITGDTSDETFRGYNGNDTIDGDGGNDTIYGGLGSDDLTGGAGTDTLRFDDLAVALTGFNIDTGTATTAADTDTFTGFENYILTNLGDSITASNSNDTINGAGGTDTIDYSAAVGALTVNLNNTTGTVTGYGTDNLSNIENIITGSGNDTVQGRAGTNNVLDGGAGTGDTLSYAYTGSAVTYDMTNVNGSGFLITIGGEQDRAQNFEIIQGSGGVDNFTGDAADNTFFGNNGNDDVTASLGDDIYNAGVGSDILRYGNATFNAFGMTVDLDVDAGGGYSEVTFAGGLTDTHLIQGFTEINATHDDDDIRGTAANEMFRGNGGNDTIYGRGGNDILEGDDGADTLYGGDGNDTLRGEGTAGDQLFGEAGDDTLYADNAGNDDFDGGTTVEVNGDTVNYSAVTTGVSASLAAGTDDDGNTLTNIENLVGTGLADTLTGDGNDNILDGGVGNDTLIGGAGDDTLIGGTGTDTVDYSGASGAIDVDLGTGTADDDGEGDSDTFSSIENIIGSAFDDEITGNNSSNDLTGGDGNDTFYSSQGNDDYIGGNDTTGDTVDYSGEADQIYYQSSSNTLYKFDTFGQDSFNGIEKIIGTSHNDQFLINTFDSGLIDFTNGIDARGGNDSIDISGLLLDSSFNAIEADFLASIFTDIEEIDFGGTTATDGSFIFTGEDIANLTADANGTLNITVDSSFTLDTSVSAGGYGAGVFDSVDTYAFTDGINTVELVVTVNA